MSSIVRQSKFRHVFCKAIKQEQCIQDVRITEVSWDSQFCAVNPKFIAVIVKGAGGPFVVLPINKAGRIDKDTPFVDAHRAACLEVQWSPFNDHVIASCSEDTTAKVWMIPELGLLRTLSEPVVELCGHQKRVNTLAWHPTAANILLTAGGENKLLLWNVGTGEALIEIAGHPDQIWSVAFNYDGSRFVTTCKDKQIRVLDSHTGSVLVSGIGHEGVKPQRAIFTKDGRIVTTGFSKRSERIYALRDSNTLEPLLQEELDTSNGVLFPLYDEDSGLCYLVGKGDCAIRYYEINDDAPFMHYINTHTTSEPQRGFGFMPKRGVNSNENEINRIYKITTKGVIDVLQFFVPRKSDLWQSDLYPDTRSMVPALTAEQFAEGKNAPPNLMPVNPEAASVKPKVQVAKKANILAQMPVQESSPQQNNHPPPQQRQIPPQQQPMAHKDTGIVRQTREPSPPPNPTHPKQQVQLKSREPPAGGGALTAGQKRAAAELDRIKREQQMHLVDNSGGTSTTTPSTTSVTPSISRRGSNSSSAAVNSEELEKIKSVLRQHERRIRLLEDMLADANMANAYGI
uniref:Coronin n=2 Tax=Meloidogyne incognita TaxID=6306 RepID=A0A914LHB4_MELIC